MKLSLLNKILLPSVATLVLLLTASSFFLANRIAKELETETLNQLNAGNTILAKNIHNSAESYKACMLAIAKTVRVREFCQSIVGEGDLTIEETQPVVQAQLDEFLRTYRQFAQFNLCDATGKVLVSSSQSGRSAVGFSVGSKEFFQRAIHGETVFSSPAINESLGEKAVVVATPVQLPSGRISAVFYCVLTCQEITQETVKDVKIGKSGYSFLVDAKSGLMLAHEDPSLIVSLNLYQTNRWLAQSPQNYGQVRSDFVAHNGTRHLLASYNEPQSGWIAMSCISEDELLESVRFMRMLTLGLMLGACLIVAFVVALVVRNLTKDVHATSIFAQAVAAGDLERTLDVRRNDELGSLGNALRTMVESLKEKILDAERQFEYAQEEALRTQQAVAEAEVSAKQAKDVQESILRMAKRLHEMGAVISQASKDLTLQIDESHKGAKDSAARLGDAASAMNEMNASVQEVAKNASSAANASEETRLKALAGADVVGKSVQSIEEMRIASLKLRDDMTELDEHAKNISHIMGVISDIADQTNLLALNAAIEAARAGEAGRGFAVVADEVRKLAEKTMESTADVAKATSAIQVSTAKSMEGMATAIERLEEATQYARESGNALREIVTNVEKTTDQVNAIATAAQEQSAASEEINRSIAKVNALSAQTAQSMNKATQSIGQLTEQTEKMNVLMKEMEK